MKIVIIFFFNILLLASSLEDKIKHLQKIEPSKRYILMNEIKKELVQLNAIQREMAIKKLKKAFAYKKEHHKRKKRFHNFHHKANHECITNEFKKFQHKHHKGKNFLKNSPKKEPSHPLPNKPKPSIPKPNKDSPKHFHENKSKKGSKLYNFTINHKK